MEVSRAGRYSDDESRPTWVPRALLEAALGRALAIKQ